MGLSGRIGGGSAKVYTYDRFNRLMQYNDGATEATYTYGADNLRASKTNRDISEAKAAVTCRSFCNEAEFVK